MSKGFVPEFIEKNFNILKKENDYWVERTIVGFYTKPFDYEDSLILVLNDGSRIQYDSEIIRPLPAGHLPEWLGIGDVVEYGEADSEHVQHSIVEQVWGKKRKGEQIIQTVVGLVGKCAKPLSEIRSVSPEFNDRAVKIKESYDCAVKSNPECFKKAPRPDSF